MATAILERLNGLRSEAYAALQATTAYRDFKVLDDAVAAMGGPRMITDEAATMQSVMRRVVETTAQRIVEGRKVSQSEAAEMALRQLRTPLTIVELMNAAAERGAEFKGDGALNSFRSMVSRDSRFATVRRGNQYFWWLRDEPLNPAWEAAGSTEAGTSTEPATPAANLKGGDDDTASTN